MKAERSRKGTVTVIEGDTGPLKARPPAPSPGGPDNGNNGGGGDGRRGRGEPGSGGRFHKRLGPINFAENLAAARKAVRANLSVVMFFTVATNVLVLAIPVYLFQISDRVLTSRSLDTLVMLTAVIVGAVLLQSLLDAIRRFILMRTAVEVAVQLGAPILSAAARASLNGSGREYQTLGDLQQLRSFLVSGTLAVLPGCANGSVVHSRGVSGPSASWFHRRDIRGSAARHRGDQPAGDRRTLW